MRCCLVILSGPVQNLYGVRTSELRPKKQSMGLAVKCDPQVLLTSLECSGAVREHN